MKVREWSIENSELIVVSGPVLKSGLPKVQGGSFNVSIPEYLFKIVLDYYPPEYKAIAFLYPNSNVPLDLDEHVVTIDSIEKLTGIDFFQKLEDKIENKIEAEHDLSKWDEDAADAEVSNKFIPKEYGKGKINTTQVKDFIGEDACVCGKVVGTKYMENGSNNPTYINLDKKFPNQLFTVMIFGKDRNNFNYSPEKFLLNRTICVKGKITTFKGSPQIIATKEKQIEIEE
jgi:endonuclease G